jgi:hypothetical protein
MAIVSQSYIQVYRVSIAKQWSCDASLVASGIGMTVNVGSDLRLVNDGVSGSTAPGGPASSVY